MKRLALSLLAFLLLGAGWPTTVVVVSDTAQNGDCSAANTPYECCTGSGTGNCTGLNGADIEDGLVACQTAGGCVLQLPCGVFENAENWISSATPAVGANVNGGGYTTGFPDGLDIAGMGSCTVLKSQITAPDGVDRGPARSTTTAVAASIFYFDQWDPPGGEPRGLVRIRVRDLVLDGQTDKQPAYDHDTENLSWYNQTEIGGDATTNYQQFHDGISARLVPGEGEVFDYCEISNVESHHFGSLGIKIGGCAQGYFARNYVHDIGCWGDFSNAVICTEGSDPWTTVEYTEGGFVDCCTGLGAGNCDTEWGQGTAVDGSLDCGCNSPSAGADCYGWEKSAEIHSTSTGMPGFKLNAGGMRHTGQPGRVLFSHNRIDNVIAHYGISCDSFGLDGKELIASDICRIDSNVITRSDIAMGTHYNNGWISNNTITEPGLPGYGPSNAVGISDNGTRRRLWILGNTFSDNQGSAIRLAGFATRPITRGLRIEGNTFSGNGDWISTFTPTDTNGATVTTVSEDSPPCENAFPTQTEIVDNTFDNTNAGYGIIRLWPTVTSCPGGRHEPLWFGANADCVADNNPWDCCSGLDTGSCPNELTATTYGAAAIDFAWIRGYQIQANGMVLNGAGDWRWMLDSTGSCAGWTKPSATVDDDSGNGIGTCP